MTRTLIGAALVATLFAAVGCDGDTPEARADDILALDGSAADGEDAYGQLCETCHEADGTGGGTFPNIGEYMDSHTDADFLLVLLDGPGGMPAFAGQSDQALADLLAYSLVSF